MKKEEIRKEFFKLRVRHHSYNQCRKIIKAKFNYDITLGTLYRWNKRLNEENWDLKDKSRSTK
jgi:transposase